MSKETHLNVVTFGEALWDCLPRGIFLGGAPLNVAYHATMLGARASILSSVGRDFLGDQTVDRCKSAGLDLSLLKRHPFLPTGVSIATLSDSGDASYEIRQPVAWDEIQLSENDFKAAASAHAFVYGTLASRSSHNLTVLKRILDQSTGLKVCDVNLRSPYDSIERALELASNADVLKLNEEELDALSGGRGGTTEEKLARCSERCGVESICLTLGGEGAALWQKGELIRYSAPVSEVADTIGAGDAFTAAFVVSCLQDKPADESLKRAVRLGGYVAGRDGAQPSYKVAEVLP